MDRVPHPNEARADLSIAKAAGVTSKLCEVSDIVALLEAEEARRTEMCIDADSWISSSRAERCVGRVRS